MSQRVINLLVGAVTTEEQRSAIGQQCDASPAGRGAGGGPVSARGSFWAALNVPHPGLGEDSKKNRALEFALQIIGISEHGDSRSVLGYSRLLNRSQNQ